MATPRTRVDLFSVALGLKCLGVQSAQELARIIAMMPVAVAVAMGVGGDIDRVARALVEQETVRLDVAKAECGACARHGLRHHPRAPSTVP